MNYPIKSEWFIADIEPSIALAKAECFEKYRTLPASEPRAINVMMEARRARAVYQRELMGRFVTFLVTSMFPRTRRRTAEAQRSPVVR